MAETRSTQVSQMLRARLLDVYLWVRSVWLAAYCAFHLFELWGIFRGFRYYVPRVSRTGFGFGPLLLEAMLVIAPLLLWSFAVIQRARGRLLIPAIELPSMRFKRAFSTVFSQSQVAEVLLLVFMWSHVAHFWARKVFMGAGAFEMHSRIFGDLSHPMMVVVHGLGLWALALHMMDAFPRVVDRVQNRDEASIPDAPTLWLSVVFAVLVFVLFAQLLGFVATGLGTFWPVSVTVPT